jgi:hypothetical protein
MGRRISGRVADQQKGGLFDDVDVEIVGARFKRNSFEGDEGTVEKTQCIVEFQIEGREDPVPAFLSCGSGKLVAPYDNPECEGDPVEEGQYLGAASDKEYKGDNENTAWAKFKAALVAKCKFPDEKFDEAVEDALVGLRGHLTTIPGGKFKGREGRPIPIFSSIEKDSIPGTKTKKKGAATVGKKLKPKVEEEEVEEEEEEEAPAPKAKVKPKAKPAAKEEVEEEDDLEASVAAAIIKAIKKGPLPKGRLAQAVGKAFEGKDERGEAVKLTMSDKFLKKGAEDEVWSYDGRQVALPGEEEEEEESE